MSEALLATDLTGVPLFRRGKVRDVYDLGDSLLFVATDRISAFDVVMANGIPGRGRILNRMSLFWFDFLEEIVPNHLITADVSLYPDPLSDYADQLTDRSMLVSKAERVDIECIVRGYLSGSFWKELESARKAGTSSIHGFDFPDNLVEAGQLAEPLFTPSSKNDDGHDENISFARMIDEVGEATANLCRKVTLEIYARAAAHARERGIIIADTKLEFGYLDGCLILIDEVLSPDSSRFWPVEEYSPGQAQVSFDKQPIRDYLAGLDWDRRPPGPALPEDVISATVARYAEAERRLTGRITS